MPGTFPQPAGPRKWRGALARGPRARPSGGPGGARAGQAGGWIPLGDPPYPILRKRFGGAESPAPPA